MLGCGLDLVSPNVGSRPVTGTKQRLCWLTPMEALDQIWVEDKCDNYELCHSAGAGVHQDICDENECVQH